MTEHRIVCSDGLLDQSFEAAEPLRDEEPLAVEVFEVDAAGDPPLHPRREAINSLLRPRWWLTIRPSPTTISCDDQTSNPTPNGKRKSWTRRNESTVSPATPPAECHWR